jgi:hypothetical protein
LKFDDFEIILGTGTGTEALSVMGFRTNGKYKCGGFYYGISAGSVRRSLLCEEAAIASQAVKGTYCKMVGYPKLIYTSQWDDRTYSD